RELAERLATASTESRPLLASGDAAGRLEMLLRQRHEHYASAHLRLDTEGKSVSGVVAELLDRLRTHVDLRNDR
ncbi:MAG: hypothetical protein M3281_03945, partial [Chloroflexota bacterium]|nr:hypothetical protein [Chloroflexota bacterium]